MTERSIDTAEPTPTTQYERFPSLEGLPADEFPNHVVIIPDGNRRYAQSLEKARTEGHKDGLQRSLGILRSMRVLPVNIVTLWAFSADNWQRDHEEVLLLMDLLQSSVDFNLEEMHQLGTKLVHLGRKDRISEGLRNTLLEAEEVTRGNKGQTIALAIDFGGEDQERRIREDLILRTAAALRENPNIPDDVLKGIASPTSTDRLRDGHGLIPPGDLLIRTSESRTSDIGWLNGKSTTLHFIEDKFFPEIDEADIANGILKYAATEHRKGR